jgi:hypothetical protein
VFSPFSARELRTSEPDPELPASHCKRGQELRNEAPAFAVHSAMAVADHQDAVPAELRVTGLLTLALCGLSVPGGPVHLDIDHFEVQVSVHIDAPAT